MKEKNATQKIVIAALLAALTCITTMVIEIPSPLKGYLNLGDCLVLFTGWMISPLYGFLAAGLGSALADLFSGYVMYAPVTFVIKGVMAVVAFYGYKLLHKKIGTLSSRIITGIAAEAIMILGYFVFEGFLYGFVPAIANIPANGMQGTVGLVLGCILTQMLEKTNLLQF